MKLVFKWDDQDTGRSAYRCSEQKGEESDCGNDPSIVESETGRRPPKKARFHNRPFSLWVVEPTRMRDSGKDKVYRSVNSCQEASFFCAAGSAKIRSSTAIPAKDFLR